MFTPGVMVKYGSIVVFSADGSKKSATVCAKYLRTSERSYLALSENAMIFRVLSYH